jgi:uridine phosphorylase
MKKTELIKNSDGSLFHLHLEPGDIAHKIIIVGDPGRVDQLSVLLTNIRVNKSNREFRTVTGTFGYDEVSIISSGIGTDNIDILMNELDALVNVDLTTGEPKKDLTQLSIIRLGTCGGLDASIPVGSPIITEIAVGFDSLIHFYGGYDWILENGITNMLVEYLEWPDTLSYPYAVLANKELYGMFAEEGFASGITISTPGFYAPQGRSIRLETFDNEINDLLGQFEYAGRKVLNYEMESSAIYGLARLLGHKALTICIVLGNRVTGEFINDHESLILETGRKILSKLCPVNY